MLSFADGSRLVHVDRNVYGAHNYNAVCCGRQSIKGICRLEIERISCTAQALKVFAWHPDAYRVLYHWHQDWYLKVRTLLSAYS